MKERSTEHQKGARRVALSTPLRLEIVGLFGGAKELSVSDMARLMGRAATSLYHHLALLENAGILRVAGTRPKGKRFESVYQIVDSVLELELDTGDASARSQLARTVGGAFRMAERDFVAALERDDLCTEGAARNLVSMRTHMRATPAFLATLNERLEAVLELLSECPAVPAKPGPNDQFLSLTLALLPLRGRQADRDNTPSIGDES